MQFFQEDGRERLTEGASFVPKTRNEKEKTSMVVRRLFLLFPLWIIALCLLILAGRTLAGRAEPTESADSGGAGQWEAPGVLTDGIGEAKDPAETAGTFSDAGTAAKSEEDGASGENPGGWPSDRQEENQGAQAPQTAVASPNRDNQSGEAMNQNQNQSADPVPAWPALDTEFSGGAVDLTPQTAPPSQKPPCFATEFDTEPLKLPDAQPTAAETELRAVWVATVFHLNYPSTPGIGRDALAEELDAIVAKAKAAGMNAIFFQVRPCSDAFYASAIFPTSRFLTGRQGGQAVLDPLAYLVKQAHAANIQVHAWINPYRVTTSGEELSSLAASNPAAKHPDWLLQVEGNYYYNPALPEVRALVAEGVTELVSGYAIDGVVFDDYFYPAGITDEDAASYSAYLAGGGRLSLGDFRRDNVNKLVESVSAAVKKIRPACLFGIAPRGIWRNASADPAGSPTAGGAAYDDIFCDAMAWVKNRWIDYLSPQLYWDFDNAAAPFIPLVDWWVKALAGSGVRFCPSLAAFALPPATLAAQQDYLKQKAGYAGYAIYSIDFL